MKHKIVLGVGIVFAIMLVAMSAVPVKAGSTWYVDGALGTDDAAHGTGPGASAFKTIQYAINFGSVVSGDTILVAQATYPESISITKGLTIRGDPGDASPGPGANAPILEGTTLGGGVPAVTISQGVSNVIFEGFEIRNYGPDGNTNADGVSVWNTGTFNVQIRDNYIHHVGYDGVLTGNGWGGPQGLHSGWVITRNIITDFGAYAVDLENAMDSQITNNVISNPTYTTTMGVVVAALSTSATSITMSNITVSGNQFNNYPDRAIQIMGWVDMGATGSAALQGVTITGNTITDSFTAITAWTSAAAGTTGIPTLRDLTITGNTVTFNNPKATGYGFHLENAAGTNTFSNNVVSFTGALGGGVSFFHAVDIKGPSTGTWTIDSNQLDGGNLGGSDAGFRLRSTLPASVVLTLKHNTITKFAWGIRSDALPNGATVTASCNNIMSNSVNGILNAALPGATINAINNWWGDATGPYHATLNPSGLGNSVSDNVNFVPWLLETYALTKSVLTATGTGIASFTSDIGCIVGLTAVPITAGPVNFPHGLFSFSITCLTPGATVTVTVTLPSNTPVGTQWWKCNSAHSQWHPLPIGSDNGDNVITITFTDGGTGDSDQTVNSVIVDPGGPGVGPAVGGEWSPINTAQIVTPWIALAFLAVAFAAAGSHRLLKKRL